MKEYLKILTQSKLFTGIRGTELDAILNCLAPTKNNFKKGAYIFRDGEQISSMGLVLRGSVHILKEDYWGNRTILAEVQTGQLFGEAYACSETAKVSVNAVSVQESAILFFDVRRILSPCSAGCPFHVRLIQNLVAELADKNIRLTGKIEHISQRRLREKVLSYLSDFSKKQGSPDFTIPFSRQELADYLSADRSALSKELCKLRDEGVLEFERKRFRLL